jgi:two-component system sensor histidine kinase KdpD
MPPEDRDARPDPDALIAAAAREGRGRLKVFLGAAPGVGKTWEMLAAARRLRAQGTDVLIGIVESHGRAETEAQVGDLPVLDRHRLTYRGQDLEEFDLDTALARRPKLLLMDELAHTNVPGSRHHKRWEDVEELRDAGIDVWATLNVQHLESQNDAVARITGVRVRETLPDRVLETADEIELIDLPPAELRARLEQGHIYRPEVARRAMEGFFREGNLAALREMALRRAAERVDADVTGYMRGRGIGGPWPAGGDRILALIDAGAGAESVVREAKRLSEALRGPWVVLHVERPGDPSDVRVAMRLATELGAEIEIASGMDVIATAIEVARRHNVTRIVIGRLQRPLWRRVLHRGVLRGLLHRAPEFALYVVPVPMLAGPPRRLPRVPEPWFAWLATVALVAAVTGLGEVLVAYVTQEALGMVFLAAVVTAASIWGLRVALFAAVLSFMFWNFFFIPPLYKLTVHEPRDVMALLLFLGVASITGALASRVRNEARTAESRIVGLRRIGAFSRALGEPATEPALLAEIARRAADIADAAVVLTAQGEDLNIRAAMPPADTMDEAAWAAARWCYARQEPTGKGTGTLPGASWRFLPMGTARGQIGVMGVRPTDHIDPPRQQVLTALVDQAAVAVERVRLANDAARSAAQSETQKLRTALLNSLSHDLRTPLAGIRGAAETMRTSWEALPAETRADLLGSIEEDTARMTRFLANILEMTRLESGEIVPRIVPVALPDVLEAAIARVPGLGQAGQHLLSDLPDDLPRVTADPALLEQVVVNVLDNAVKYAPTGGFVRVSATQHGYQVVLSVADEGVGIAPEDLPHVFDSFYRAKRGDRVAPGTGLGLAIARGLMEAMGGSIEAISPRPDAPADGAPGAVIQLRLPLAP